MRKFYRSIVMVMLLFVLVSPALNAQEVQEKVNINTATAEQLITLPGIGDTTAEKIIKYRESNGNFESKNQLMEIKGIGESKFEKIRTLISL